MKAGDIAAPRYKQPGRVGRAHVEGPSRPGFARPHRPPDGVRALGAPPPTGVKTARRLRLSPGDPHAAKPNRKSHRIPKRYPNGKPGSFSSASLPRQSPPRSIHGRRKGRTPSPGARAKTTGQPTHQYWPSRGPKTPRVPNPGNPQRAGPANRAQGKNPPGTPWTRAPNHFPRIGHPILSSRPPNKRAKPLSGRPANFDPTPPNTNPRQTTLSHLPAGKRTKLNPPPPPALAIPITWPPPAPRSKARRFPPSSTGPKIPPRPIQRIIVARNTSKALNYSSLGVSRPPLHGARSQGPRLTQIPHLPTAHAYLV